jgi:hypothetical protein
MVQKPREFIINLEVRNLPGLVRLSRRHEAVNHFRDLSLAGDWCILQVEREVYDGNSDLDNFK